MDTRQFHELLWQKNRDLFREMPWRTRVDPYAILVSEIMLQQTQVDRVIPKFNAFMQQFPRLKDLANSELSEVLRLWSGLGYNRRAKFLHQASQKIMHDFSGVFPSTKQELMTLPGIGVNTAAAILNYAFEIATPYIETNIRTVFFYHFFEYEQDISDAELLKKVSCYIDTEHPREYHWALMDYGAYLKKSGVKNSSQSKHYKKQAKLSGSKREMRGRIIKVLTQVETISLDMLGREVNADDRFLPALESLTQDGLIKCSNNNFHLTK